VTHKLMVTAISAALALTGCQTFRDNPKTTTGAVAGAAGGAALGAVVSRGNRGKGALIGAAVGALAGTGIGYYMDEQERKLRQQTAGSGVGVARVGDNIVLNLPDNISFDVGKAEIKPQFMPVLDDVAETLRAYYETRIEIAGHTDSTGSAQTNQALSENRAKSVKSYLSSRGVAAERMATVGFGPSRPVATNATAEGRAKNRRVAIILIPAPG